MYLTLPAARRRFQPQGAVRLAANSLTGGALAAFCASSSTRELVSNKHWTSTTSGPAPDSTQGLAVYCSVPGSNYLTTPIAALPTSWTLAVMFRHVANNTADQGIIGICEAPGNSTFDRTIRLGAGSVYEGYLYDTASKKCAVGSIVTGALEKIVVTASGTSLRAYRAGYATPAATTISTTGHASYTSPELCIGRCTSTFSSLVFYTYLGYFGARAWSEGEAQAWFSNPWQIFAPDPRPLYFDLSRPKGTMRPTVWR